MDWGPKTPSLGGDSGNPTYDIGATRNQARLGGAIPVCYGAPLTIPDFAATPYTYFARLGTNDMYLDSLFCIGVGEFEEITAADIFIGETPVSDMPLGIVQFNQFQKAGPVASPNIETHGAIWGPIKSKSWNDPGFNVANQESPFLEDCYTHPAMSGWEFNADKVAGSRNLPALKAGQKIEFIPSGIPIGLWTRSQIKVPAEWAIRTGLVVSFSGTASNNAVTGIVSVVAPDESAGAPVDTVTEADGTVNTYPLVSILTILSVVTAEVSTTGTMSIDSTSSNRVAGPYYSSPIGQGVVAIYFDFTASQGLYRARSSGKFDSLGGGNIVKLELKATPLIDGTNTIDATLPVVTKIQYINHNRPEPVRRTFYLHKNTSKDGGSADIIVGKRYQIQVTGLHSMTDNRKTQNDITWAALRVELDHTGEELYGETTLLAVRMKATNGVSGQAQSQLKVRARRKYKCLDGTVKTSGNPADITNDIFTDTYHGMSRPDTEIDLTTFNGLRDLWDMGPAVEAPVFNGVFADKSTCWDGMQSALAMAVARPAIDAGALTIVADKKKPIYQYVFNDQNIVKDSFKATYAIDVEGENDGIEVAYRDYDTFNPAYVIGGPADSVNPIKQEYFGVTDANTAQKLANLLWNRRIYQRQAATFSVEMDGMVPQVGDRVLVGSPVVRWGISGRVMGVRNGNILILDKRLDWSTGNLNAIVLTDDADGGKPHAPIGVTKGPADNEVILGLDPGITLDLSYNQEPPKYTIQSFVGVAKDMTVVKITHNGGVTFTVQAALYPIVGFAGHHALFKDAPLHITLDNTGAPL